MINPKNKSNATALFFYAKKCAKYIDIRKISGIILAIKDKEC